MKGQMGPLTFLFLFSLAFGLVSYMVFGDTPLFFTLAACIGSNPQLTCSAFLGSLGSNLWMIVAAVMAAMGLIFFISTATGGISLTATQFPNPYAYFAPIAGALLAIMLTVPSQMFTDAYGLPWAIQAFLIGTFSFVEGMAIVSWLKGGAQA
jgi:hypothetical protein